jgi:hypothetical protein
MVECYSGHEYPERPLAFECEGQRKQIESIIESHRTPRGRFFRVRTKDNQLFDLSYDEALDAWSITQR